MPTRDAGGRALRPVDSNRTCPSTILAGTPPPLVGQAVTVSDPAGIARRVLRVRQLQWEASHGEPTEWPGAVRGARGSPPDRRRDAVPQPQRRSRVAGSCRRGGPDTPTCPCGETLSRGPTASSWHRACGRRRRPPGDSMRLPDVLALSSYPVTHRWSTVCQGGLALGDPGGTVALSDGSQPSPQDLRLISPKPTRSDPCVAS